MTATGHAPTQRSTLAVFLNDGLAPGPVRDPMAAAGITINGLCILHEEPDLLQAYTDEVIGGPGAFALTCQEHPAFASAMKQKLTREINAPIV
jgi:Ca-activated chloride channel homolog